MLRGEKIHQPRIMYPGKLFFRSKEGMKTFSDAQKLRELLLEKYLAL